MADTPSTPAAPSSPSTPSTPAASTPATSSTPATPSTPSTPSTPAASTPSTPSTPATPATPSTPAGDPASAVAGLPDDLASLLADDLKEPVAAVAEPGKEPPPAGADPLEALKDNPRVQELVKAETSLKAAMALAPEYIKEPDHVQAAVQDAAVLWAINEGKRPVTELLNAAKTVNPQGFPKLLADLKTFVEKETGQSIAGAPVVDEANMTPEQKRIAALEKEAADRKAADAKAAEDRERATFQKRVTDAKTTVTNKITELLKGTAWEGESDLMYVLVGNLIPRDKAMQVIESAEKGDFKLVESALTKARSLEAKRFVERVKRLKELQAKKVATVPNQATSGSPAPGSAASSVPAITDKEARRKKMLEEIRSA